MNKEQAIKNLHEKEMPVNTLIQFSTTWCGPCKQAKSYIMTTYAPDEGLYKFIDMESEDLLSIYIDIAQILKIKGVPVFAVVDIEDKEIKATWIGFNKAKIDEYFGIK
jgi:thioredoxin-like negative regulator of GroEL